MKNLTLLSLPELGQYQRELEAAQTRETTVARHEEMWRVELEIREREEEIEKRLDALARARMPEENWIG